MQGVDEPSHKNSTLKILSNKIQIHKGFFP